jgi:L-lysine exporter family protein LysE/ArgO
MNLDFLAGLATGLSLIVAIGSQNAFVLRQGLRREHVLPVVLFCSVSDGLLILAGVAGAGALVQGHPALLELTRYGGAAFLGVYGLLAARRAWTGGHLQVDREQGSTLGAALAACFAFTFLNPHVYLDTVVLVGSVANQRGEAGRWWFAGGAALGSLLWFSSLGYGARLLVPWFEKDVAWRILDSVIALVMLALCGSLLMG